MTGLPTTGRTRTGPVPKNELVSAQMRRMPRTSTGPELALRRQLHAAGLRFRVNRRELPGTPDVVLSRAKLAVFVDGCFWHACPDHGTLPKNNRDWWRQKLELNRERDLRKDRALIELGWLPLRFWEHQPIEDMVGAVVRLWRERTRRPSCGGTSVVPDDNRGILVAEHVTTPGETEWGAAVVSASTT